VASLLVSALAGAAVYLLLNWLFVRPVERLTHRVERFSRAPEDASIFADPSRRTDEVGRAERALVDMAGHVRASLRQRERLAGLGAAVARIAHDLRNVLATAQLVTERLNKSEDPAVRQAAPRLERAIGRAAGLAAAALRYGKAEEAAPVLSPVRVHAAVADALDDALTAFPTLPRRADVAEELIAITDPEQLHRILVNLIRNAAQAAASIRPDAEDAVVVSAERRGAAIAIAVRDRGAGVPEAARGNLFQPFVSADRAGGAGLGLAISRELARAQGGDVQLSQSSPEGAVFEATLPAA
jgi:signal transduction histidine kinase